VAPALTIDLDGGRHEAGIDRFEGGTRGRAAIYAIYVPPSKFWRRWHASGAAIFAIDVPSSSLSVVSRPRSVAIGQPRSVSGPFDMRRIFNMIVRS
jgi:hypothetical protein